MNIQAREKMSDARGELLATQPFFGVLALKLELVEDSTIKTARVTSKTLAYNPAYVLGLVMAELKTVIAHEVLHLGLMHHTRAGARDHEMWNEACDHAVNHILKAEGFHLPAGCMCAPEYAGKPAEEIYNALRDKKAQDKPQQNGAQKPGNGPQQAGGGSAGAPQPGAGAPAPGGAPGAPGKPVQGDSPTGDFMAAGPDGSAAEAEAEAMANANEAMRVASSAGKLPGGVRRVVSEAVTPKAEWGAILRRFMTDQVRTESTWSKRNKRFSDVYLPGRKAAGMGAVVLAVDTSGSISAATLARFAAEINAIIEDVEPARVVVVYCDARVNAVREFEQGERVTLDACGGGGTRFAPVFDHVDSEGLTPAALVYLTDLDNRAESSPPSEPAYPVLWAAYDNGARVGAFGETVSIN